MVGKVLGRYQLVEEIGQGGMAVVYRGVDTSLKREVAVKVLHPHLSRKQSSRDRFAREAKVVAALHHDNIVEIYDFSSGDETGNLHPDAFIVTEFIRGRTLADFLEKTPRERIPVEVAALIVAEVCRAVGHAHEQGVIHRDIKPENVMIRQDGVLKLMDFGIARIADESGSTMTGTIMGSPQFMSPEQVTGGTLDAKSDLFSIGVLLYRLLTGALPFEGPNPAATLRAILEQEPDPPERVNPRVPRKLAAVAKAALSKDPSERPASGAAFADALLAGVAEAEMGPAREELKAYFADPPGYCAVLQSKLLVRYRQAGEKRRKSGDSSGAMELWGQVLELDPGNAEVRLLLSRLGRRRRMTALALRASLGVAGLAFFVAVSTRVVAIFANAAPGMGPSPTPTLVVIAPSPTPSIPVSVAPPSPTPTRAMVHASIAPRPSATPAPTDTRVAMLPSPAPAHTPYRPAPGKGALWLPPLAVAEVFVDGRPREKELVELFARGGIDLNPGDHEVVIRPTDQKSGCQPLKRTFHIVEGEVLRPSDVTLEGCHTYFQITNVTVVLPVQVDGQEAGATGSPIRTTRGKHTIRITDAGGKKVLWEKDVELTAVHSDDPQMIPASLQD